MKKPKTIYHRRFKPWPFHIPDLVCVSLEKNRQHSDDSNISTHIEQRFECGLIRVPLAPEDVDVLHKCAYFVRCFGLLESGVALQLALLELQMGMGEFGNQKTILKSHFLT